MATMASHLTRTVFRRIIANEPLLHCGCRSRIARPLPIARYGFPSNPQVSRRPFMNLFKQRRKMKDKDVPPGLEKMSELVHAQRTESRAPPPEDVAKALREFFSRRVGPFENYHMALARTSLEYLLENPSNGQPWFTREQLINDLYEQLVKKDHLPETNGEEHVKFGRLLITEIGKMTRKETSDPISEMEAGAPTAHLDSDQQRLIRLLALFGESREALDILLRHHSRQPEEASRQEEGPKAAWGNVLSGLVLENDTEEITRVTELIYSLSIPLTKVMQQVLVEYFAERRDLERAKFWYNQPTVDTEANRDDAAILWTTNATLLKACALCGDLLFGQEVVTYLLRGDMPDKLSWDAIFLWSAAIGKGVDEVDRMMNVMIRRNDEAREKDRTVEIMRPDIDTVNTLVEYSMSQKDPYTAERFINLGEKRGILPNERTYSMQVDYRLSIGDIDGARTAYFNLQGDFSGAPQSVAVINRLIQALCNSKQHHFDELMAMVDDLHERKASFAAETTAALCTLHLRRGEINDAIDLLQVHAHQYSPEQRKILQNCLKSFILDGETSTADAWDAYQMLRNVFPEATRDDRIKVMNEFFARQRSDMACHVFFHMRNHPVPSRAANREVYIAAFTGFARCADAESIELAHNQLKLDMSIDLDTELSNSLMLAYAAIGEHRKALEFWRAICESKEGPSYNSIPIAFRSCEGMHNGFETAKSIWRRLQEQDVEIDKDIWVAYMSAISRNHHYDEALEMIESVEEEYGFVPDLQILGNWFNTTASSEKQERVETWIKTRYPEVWKEMEALGHWVTMDGFGYRQYNINRNLDP